MSESLLSLFAVAAPGLENVVAQELRELGLSPHVETGGVAFSGSLPDMYRANRQLRVASRVLARVGEFHATEFWDLYKQARRLPWAQFVTPGQPATMRVTCHKSKLYHSDAVAQRLMKAVDDAVRQPVRWVRPAEDEEADDPPQLIVVRLAHDHCTLSVDSSGALLHRRGYRQATAKAPLRETLAAGLVRLAGWDGRAPLLDPFCGAGTIALEAAQWAAHLTPGRARRFAYQHWPRYDAAHDPLPAEDQPTLTTPLVWASDRDAGAITATQGNAERAGVGALLHLRQCALSAIEPPPGPGWVITNPPYGLRVQGTKDLRDLYAQLGHVLRDRCAGWRVAFLCPDAALAHQTRFNFIADQCVPLVNGGQRVTLWQALI